MFGAEWKCGLHMWFSKALDLLLLLVLFHINGRYCVRHANTPTDSIPLQCDDVSLCSLFDWEEPTFSHSAMSNSLQPMNYNTPGFPVLHYFPEFAQAHVHWVCEAIQSSHLLSLLSPPALKSFPASVFSNESALRIRWPKYWSFSFSISPSNEYLGLISFRIDWFVLAV